VVRRPRIDPGGYGAYKSLADCRLRILIFVAVALTSLKVSVNRGFRNLAEPIARAKRQIPQP
jgi:hypothetical protein